MYLISKFPIKIGETHYGAGTAIPDGLLAGRALKINLDNHRVAWEPREIKVRADLIAICAEKGIGETGAAKALAARLIDHGHSPFKD